MLFKLSNLNSNLSLTLGYLNPAYLKPTRPCRLSCFFKVNKIGGDREHVVFVLILEHNLQTKGEKS